MKNPTPLFATTTLFHLASVATRFDTLAAKIPARVALAILGAQFPLLLIEGWFESRIDHGGSDDFPLWMRIRSRPIKWSFTLAFIYLTVAALQTWNVSIGPINPTPPLQWPLAERAGWYAMFTLGMSFVFYLAATGQLIPALRLVTRPLRSLPALVAVPILTAAGVAAGYGVASLVAWKAGAAAVARVQATLAAFQSNPTVAIAWTAGMVWGPILIGWIVSLVAQPAAAPAAAATPSESPPGA